MNYFSASFWGLPKIPTMTQICVISGPGWGSNLSRPRRSCTFGAQICPTWTFLDDKRMFWSTYRGPVETLMTLPPKKKLYKLCNCRKPLGRVCNLWREHATETAVSCRITVKQGDHWDHWFLITRNGPMKRRAWRNQRSKKLAWHLMGSVTFDHARLPPDSSW